MLKEDVLFPLLLECFFAKTSEICKWIWSLVYFQIYRIYFRAVQFPSEILCRKPSNILEMQTLKLVIATTLIIKLRIYSNSKKDYLVTLSSISNAWSRSLSIGSSLWMVKPLCSRFLVANWRFSSNKNSETVVDPSNPITYRMWYVKENLEIELILV